MSGGLLLVLVLLGCMFLGAPVVLSLAISCVVYIFLSPIVTMNFFVENIINGATNFVLLAIPFFILSGEIMSAGGISKRLIELCTTLLKRVKGLHAVVTVFACMFFSALSGSAAATVACIGGIMIPQMIRNGYDKGFATAVTTASGALGPIIPPSVLMLIYGVAVQVSIADLFLAGVIPGIMIAFVLAVIAQRMVIKANFETPPDVAKENEVVFQLSIPRAFKRAIFALFAPVIILGGIYGGIFTPTEAAIVACVYALVVSLFIYRELKFRDLHMVFTKAARSCNFLIIIALSAIFGRLLAIEGITVGLADFVTGMTDNKYIVLLIINVMLFLISLIVDAGPAIIILAPILANVVAPYGICMVHFGIIMVINLAIGLTTPPVGVNLLVGTRISGVKMGDTFRPLVPLLSGIIVILLLVTYIPQIALFLPNLLRG